MGLLDELKEKADQLRSHSAQLAATEAELSAFYQAQLKPKMYQAYNFAQQLVDHLNLVNEAIPVSYPLLPDDTALDCLQQDYSVLVDSRDEPTHLEVRCKAIVPTPVELQIKGKAEVLRYSHLLDSYQLRYQRTDSKDERLEIVSSRFKIIGPIPIRLAIKAHTETRSLEVLLRNISGAGVTAKRVLPEKFTDDFLDRLGRYLLRQPVDLFSSELSEDARQRLRERLKQKREVEAREHRALEVQRAALAQAEHENRPAAKLSKAVQKAGKQIRKRLTRIAGGKDAAD